MPISPLIDSLRRKMKPPTSSFRVKASPVLSLSEGAVAVMTYTPAADKMKVFSAFIREGIENGDRITYTYPNEESGIVRDELKKHGIDVEKCERNGTLRLRSLTEHFMTDGNFDKDRAVKKGLDERVEAKKKGYKHLRELEDVGNFSFLNGKWQKYLEYWNDPKWETPSGPYTEILDYTPFMMELTTFNLEGINEAQLAEMLKAFWVESPSFRGHGRFFQASRYASP